MSNFYNEDPNLKRLLKEMLPADFYKWADNELEAFGTLTAGPIDERAVHTDREGQPQLIRYDKMGNEVSQVLLNEGYKKTVEETYNAGIVGYIHKEIPALGYKGNYVYSFAQGYLLSHAEPGFYCPVTLSMATAYLIDHYASDDLKQEFLPHVLATGDVELYEGATLLTERQGGSDVGANEVEAVKEGEYYRITGEKYFASNAGACGVAMVLARLEGAPEGTRGLSLFLVPWEENRAAGQLRIRRLKDKLGVRAVPSAEVEFEGAKGYLVGEANNGFSYMIEALNLSRVSNAVASLGIMRRAYLEAKSYATDRVTFGNKLTMYPMVQATLSEMAAKQEVEMNAMFEVIGLMDLVMGLKTKVERSEKDQILFRLYVAIMKKETAEQAIHFSHEAIEMHGGNGYIEDFVTPRLLRDAQVLTVWEGTANILGLEVLRLVGKYQAAELFEAEMKVRLAKIADEALKSWVKVVELEILKLMETIGSVKELSRNLQTYYSKEIAKRMADIFESVVALEMSNTEGSRDKAVAAVYLQSLWKKDEFQKEPVTLEKFSEIVGE
ncbi:alkylation response protein AidB-like acyl-CoA dehydrogenase [Virgibacillus natechei]|uniref:Alkylation response protein AidB-like acyl-CoA dehydrogenase n=1 Tax=Virgibacillus natechei TaxID=1216297 RepID=A0ABS4IKS5_9BACI|nr:acyl-CoA dehydrogenase family protein [Virgibacillus natechei]MBP1971536.1 alkylation response protein AidB-like acyl-CoA dehydrogenase [Virgibacillus natechei]UZD11993.1 acyl-CoA dehydrogenase family protein [Virgibacillus natechei]